jgi:hypothetical protein
VSELRELIRDAELELSARLRKQPREPANRGQRAFVADLANRPVCGFDLASLRSLYGLDFTSELTVSGLVYASYSYIRSAGLSYPIKTFASALRIRTLLTLEGLQIPWQMDASGFPEFRRYIAEIRDCPVDWVDALYLSRLSGLARTTTARWLRAPQRYPVTGPTARWFAFVKWVLDCYPPSGRQRVLSKILRIVDLEVRQRAKAGLAAEEKAARGEAGAAPAPTSFTPGAAAGASSDDAVHVSAETVHEALASHISDDKRSGPSASVYAVAVEYGQALARVLEHQHGGPASVPVFLAATSLESLHALVVDPALPDALKSPLRLYEARLADPGEQPNLHHYVVMHLRESMEGLESLDVLPHGDA